MKKTVALMLALIMSLSLLASCGDPVADDFENFLNVQMVDVNATYDAIVEEAAKWETYETDAQLFESINSVLIPNVDKAIDQLSKVTVETEEVKAIKDMFQAGLDAYKEGFTTLVDATNAGDAAKMEEANTKLQEGIAKFDEYNKALDALAAEKGMTIER